MIEEQATVTSVEGQTIVVESIVKSACSSCQQLESCGSGQISKAFPQKSLSYTLSTEKQISVGDSVVIGLSEQILLSAAWRVYMWPLIGLISGSFLGQLLYERQILPYELLALTVGLIGGYVGYRLARAKLGQSANCTKWTPSLIRINPKHIPVTKIPD